MDYQFHVNDEDTEAQRFKKLNLIKHEKQFQILRNVGLKKI